MVHVGGWLADRIVLSGGTRLSEIGVEILERESRRSWAKIATTRRFGDDEARTLTKMTNYRGFDYYIEIKWSILQGEIQLYRD